jgi:archaemetzincin
MALESIRMGVVPLGDVPEIVPRTIAGHFIGYLNLEADLMPPLKIPHPAYDRRRFQYDAGVILHALEKESFSRHTKIVGVLDVDLFVPIFSHVFGEARQGGNLALVSLFRLKKNRDGSKASTARLLERAAKVALHETGHLFSLFHCMDERCLMHFAGGVAQLDNTPLYFCRYCSVFLRDSLQLSVSR